jgi:uncharacterized membrane protein YdjX (TVP38/TMEM64 family)
VPATTAQKLAKPFVCALCRALRPFAPRTQLCARLPGPRGGGAGRACYVCAAMTWLHVRRIALLLVLASCATGGVWLWRAGDLNQAALSEWVRSFGALAPPAFILAFALGEVVHLPGTLFVVLARAAFGPVGGLLLAYVGGVIAVTAPFLLARGLRQRRERAWQPRWRWAARALERVEAYPVRSVIVLRLVLWLSPPLDYALAFTSIRTRDYVIGSALGLMPSIAAVVFGVGWLL